jgi:hypothetical protein
MLPNRMGCRAMNKMRFAFDGKSRDRARVTKRDLVVLAVGREDCGVS